MATTAKVFLSSKGDPSDGQVFLAFTADYADGANKEWAKYTPALSISMTVLEEVAADWKSGDHFTLTFEKEE
jgi:hypothetical protein